MKKLRVLTLVPALLASLFLWISPAFSTDEINPPDDKAIFERGVLLLKQGQHSQAVAHFTTLIKRSPNHAEAYKNRGVAYMRQQEYDLAIQDFEKARSIFPNLNGVHSNLGVAWYYKKEYEKAIENYDIELGLAPDNAIAYFNRALCHGALGQQEKALADLGQTLEIKPDFYWAVCFKADLLAGQKQYSQAVIFYEKALALEPDNPYAADKLARIRKQVQSGKPEERGGQAQAAPARTQAAPPEKTPPARTKSQKKPAAPGQIRSFALQAGAFQNKANATRLLKRLRGQGFDARVLELLDSSDRTWHLVRCGDYPDRASAARDRTKIKEQTGLETIIRRAGGW